VFYELSRQAEQTAAITELRAEVEGLKEENRKLLRSAG
jgi:hypothetical protein